MNMSFLSRGKSPIRSIIAAILVWTMVLYSGLGFGLGTIHAGTLIQNSIEIDSVEGVRGSAVTMSVYIEPSDGIWQYDVAVTYKSDALELDTASGSPVMHADGTNTLSYTTAVNPVDGTSSVHVTNMHMLLGKEKVFTVRFKVKDTAPDGDTPVTVSGTVTEDTNPLQALAMNGKVTINAKPVASQVKVSGTTQVGQTLTGSYSYSDAENDTVGASVYQWYRADDAAGLNKVAITGATSVTYTLTSAELEKYVLFEVTPAALTGDKTGVPVLSTGVGPVEAVPVIVHSAGVMIGDIAGSPGQVVDVPVTVYTASAGIGSYGMKLSYDPSLYEVKGITGNTGGLFDSHYDNTAGWLKAAWADATGGDQPAVAGDKLFTISLMIKNVPANGAGLSVETGVLSSFTFTDTLAVEMNKVLYNGQVQVTANPKLSSLTVSAGNLSPAFDTDTSSYAIQVPFEVSKLTVTATAQDEQGTIKVNGYGATQGAPSPQLDLQEGNNVLTVLVTARDGITTKSYQIQVNRANEVLYPDLNSLVLSEGSLSPAFDKNTTAYTAQVPFSVSEVHVTAAVYDSRSTLKLNGQVAASGAASAPIALQEGENTIEVVVTAKDGHIAKTYTIQLNREYEVLNVDLSSLALSAGTLSPAFAKDKTAYSAQVPNSVSDVKVTATVDDSRSTLKINGQAAVSGTASGLIPLNVGDNTIELVVTSYNNKLSRTYTMTVKREEEEPSSSGSGPAPAGQGFRVIVDGKPQDQIATGVTTKDNNRTIITANVDGDKLKAQLDKEGAKPTVIIPVTTTADTVSAVLSGDAMKAMESKQATLVVQTPNGSYKLPAQELALDNLVKRFDGQVPVSDLKIQVDVTKSSDAKVSTLDRAAAAQRFSVVTAPVDFKVTASYHEQSVAIDTFSSYVERELALPSDVDASKITTGVVLEADGTVRHVPTHVMKREASYYAVINSLTNSTYTLIWNPKSFLDVTGHWAQDAVNSMASRMIVNGVDANSFNPDAAITRAEFAAIVVRALGLPNSSQATEFEDVLNGQWFAGAVQKAYEYGIIEGYDNRMFHPNQTITRQEAMVMIARAMRIVGLDQTSNADVDAALSAFADQSQVAAWAKTGAAALVQSKLVVGSDTGLKPSSLITRAETAVIVKRLLEQAQLIDSNEK
ncbi:cadherin-like beta sandwich domain-containing protein [Paenibacillus sp. YYML68]|uniref:cadherin-like beta sandwich domain-containing protein n=1 Tax=Paenibacillus sp. YYML68 TaxID=2909250 RepID=UPI002493B1FA|nr:cadherin-like beta sandwich domain-containing protein [Paenibacillus sp. YYML68]